MFEEYFTGDGTICNPAEKQDMPVKFICISDREKADPSRENQLGGEKVFLISSASPPAAGALFICSDGSFLLNSVRKCRSLDGEKVIWRCTAD